MSGEAGTSRAPGASTTIALGRLAGLIRSRTGVLALTTAGTLVVRTASSMVLTRILSPDDFGIAGIVNSIFWAISMLTDLGFQLFIIRDKRGDDRHFLDVLWTIHATRGFILTLVAAASSPFVALVLGKTELALPLAVASVSFLINGLTSLSLISALRHDQARRLSLLELGLQVAQTVICILLALWWRNSWALIAAINVQQILRAGMSFLCFPDARHAWRRDPAIRREFLAFSKVVISSSALSLIISQTDKVVLAQLFTLREFGLYAIAVTLAQAPAAFVDNYVSRVLFPVCSRIWRDVPHQLGATYYKVRRYPSLLFALTCGGMIGASQLLIAILYDPRYAAAASYLSILMVATATRFPNQAATDTLAAIGEVRMGFRANVLRVAWLIVGIPIGYHLAGTLGLVVTVGLIELPPMLFLWAMLRRFGLLHLGEELLFLGTIGGGAAIGLAGATAILHAFPHI